MTTTFTRGENPLKADKLNTAFAERVSRGGDTMQGLLTLVGDPVGLFDAATKQYVDARQGPVGPTGVQGPPAGRNLIHNPLFNIAQRGTGPFTANGAYTLDRWQIISTLDTVSITQSSVNDAGRAAIGDEQAYFVLLNTFIGNAGAAANNFIRQPIENVRRLSGKTVTVSFWAWSGAGTPKLGVSIDQYFGTGGSPSSPVSGAGQAVTLSTTQTRYSMTFIVPSINGKILGSNNNDGTYLNLWFSSGANINTQAGGIGVQSGTVALWGVQLEVGSVATPLEKPDPHYDLSNCQRFYQARVFTNTGYAPVPGTTIYQIISLSVSMRVVPTIIPTFTVQTNCGSSTATALADSTSVLVATTNVGGPVNWTLTGSFTASADL